MIRLYSGELLSKWGFEDGDLVSNFMIENMSEDIDINEHNFLKYIVKKYLVSKITNNIQLVEIDCIHNPIRINILDGKNVVDLWYDGLLHNNLFNIEYVEIDDDVFKNEIINFKEG